MVRQSTPSALTIVGFVSGANVRGKAAAAAGIGKIRLTLFMHSVAAMVQLVPVGWPETLGVTGNPLAELLTSF